MPTNIAQLRSVFEHKKEIFKNLKKYAKPVAEFAEDTGIAYEDESQHLILERHHFSQNEGLLPLIEGLIETNNLLLAFEKPLHMGELVVHHYDKMIELIRQEQRFLINYFRRTLLEVMEHKAYHEYWASSFANYQKLLEVLRLDLTYFSLVLQTHAKNAVYWVVNLMQQEKFDDAMSYIETEGTKVLGKEEIIFLMELLKNIIEGHLEETYKTLEEKKDLLEEDEYTALRIVLHRILVNELKHEFEEIGILIVSAKQLKIPNPRIKNIAGLRNELNLVIRGLLQLLNFAPKLPKKSRFELIRSKISRKKGSENMLERQLVERGLKLLAESKEQKELFWHMLKLVRLHRATILLDKEFENLTKLLAKIENKKRKYPGLIERLNEIIVNINRRLFDDINSAKSIAENPEKIRAEALDRIEKSYFPESWRKLLEDQGILEFIPALAASISRKRQELEFAVDNIGVSKTRRKMVIGLGAAAATVAGAGIYKLMEKERIPVRRPGSDIELPFIEPNFGTLTIPEVNKTIYTEGKYKNAKYIVVIPHSTELNALEAAREAAKGPVTYVAGNDDRNLKIRTKEGIFEIDPNNAFCMPGITRCFEFLYGKEFDSLNKETQNYIISVIRKFTDEVSRRIFWGKMVLALHQNTKNNFGIRSYKNDPRFSRYAADVYIDPNERDDDFAYVTTRGWFEVLKSKGWNVVLQKNDNHIDDGSISYAATWRNSPYVNIEVEIGDAQKQVEHIKIVNDLIEQYPQLATDMNFIPFQDATAVWDRFEKDVRDGKISKNDAKNRLDQVIFSLRVSLQKYPQLYSSQSENWAFPIQNGNARNILYGKGDYHPNNPSPPYDFFDGNKHGGHPAYDIFINEKDVKIDKNNDGLIDSTDKPAIAVSCVKGIVASINKGWVRGSELRGGNYVWIYNPYLDMFFYYAHLNEVLVSRGQLIEQGQPIGTIGKTGSKAIGTECHVHLMVLKHIGSDLVPVDYHDNIVYSQREDLKSQLKFLYNDLRSRYPVKDNENVIITLGDYQKLFLVSGFANEITMHKEYGVSTGKGGFGAITKQGKTPAGVMRIGPKIGDKSPIGAVFQSLRFTGQVVPISYTKEDRSHPFMTTRLLVLEGVEEQNRHFTTIRIHGTNKEGLIGQPDSSGCVRMRNNDVIELFDLVPSGTYVYIVPQSPSVSAAAAIYNDQLVMDDPEIVRFMETMTPEEKAAQMIISYMGFTSRHGIGGVVLNQYSMRGELVTKALTRTQNMLFRIPVLFGADQEGGIINRLQNIKGFQSLPSAYQMRTMDDSEIEAVQQRVAECMKNLGVNANFAPCLDVSSNPLSVAHRLRRSFGSDAKTVVEKATHFSKPFCKENIALFGKHFPGYGDLIINTDNEIVDYRISLDELNYHISVYKELAQHLSGVMMCSAIYPAVDSEPAVFSSKIVGMGRKIIGQYGVIITDDVISVGMRKYINLENALEKCILAGNDMVLTMSAVQVPKITNKIASLYRSNETFRRRINNSVYRILKLKKKLYSGSFLRV